MSYRNCILISCIFSLLLLLVACNNKKESVQATSESATIEFIKNTWFTKQYEKSLHVSSSNITKDQLKKESDKVPHDYWEIHKKIIVKYRQITTNKQDKKANYEVFLPDYRKIINLKLQKNNNKWLVTDFSSKDFEADETDTLNKYEWNSTELKK
ncbi:hypothetical protein [Priestia aryabhattai]